MTKEHEITSLTRKNSQLEEDVEKLEEQLASVKKEALEGSQHGVTSDNLQRKLTILEEEAEEADKLLREANEKYVELHR